MRFLRIGLGAVGLIALGSGAWLLLGAAPRWSDRISAAGWFLGPAIASDAVILPLFAGVGWLGARRLDARWRAPVTAGLILTAAVLAVGWPFLADLGRRPDNLSLLDRNYPAGVALLLAVIWAVMVGWVLVRKFGNRSLDRPSDVG